MPYYPCLCLMTEVKKDIIFNKLTSGKRILIDLGQIKILVFKIQGV